MSDSDFLSFENALGRLSLEEDDLKRLISAGEIRAFRDGSKMRLRAEDVQRVAQDLGVGGSVGEEDAGEVLEVEEVLFSESAEDEGMVTTQLSEEDTLLDDDLEVVEIDESPAPTRRSSGGGNRQAARPRAAAAEEVEVESTGIRAVAVLTCVLMLYGMAFVVSMLDAKPSGATKPIVNMVHGENNASE